MLLVGLGLHLFLLFGNVPADLVSFTHGCVMLAATRLPFMISFINADHGDCGGSVILSGSGSVTMLLSCEPPYQVISQMWPSTGPAHDQ